MNILLLGSGGRENAIAWKIAQSPLCDQLFIAPGNAGSSRFGINLSIDTGDFESVKKTVLEHQIAMVVVGPEDPLVNGIRDFIENEGQLKSVKVIGPGKSGARLEGSKDFSKQFMQRHRIPTAAYASFTGSSLNEGYAFLETLHAPYVLKADGLAAGKGVFILDDLQEAKAALKSMLTEAKFGAASATVVIEEFLSGIEVSVFVLTDGKDYLLLPEAKDYKRIGEKDTGPNTGGMGAVSPVPFADKQFMAKVESQIIKPTIEGLKQEAIDYKGFIFFGLINVGGDPFVIEYNARMGDPETEVVIPRIQNDLVELFNAVAEGKIRSQKLETDPRTAVTVMLVSGGYPDSYEKHKVMLLPEHDKNSVLFHAGTVMKDGALVTAGGRVLAITSYGTNINEALSRSMKLAAAVTYEKKYYRKDIGQDLIPMEIGT